MAWTTPDPPHRARILIAGGLNNAGVVMATDSAWVEHDVDGIGNSTLDLGLDPPGIGLWLWEGTIKETWSGFPGEETPDTEYTGEMRSVLFSEMLDLMAMTPPETCLLCGKPATTYYPDEESGAPSCGAAACELRMQAAEDYHHERGGRPMDDLPPPVDTAAVDPVAQFADPTDDADDPDATDLEDVEPVQVVDLGGEG